MWGTVNVSANKRLSINTVKNSTFVHMQKNPFKMKHILTLLLLLAHVVAFAQNEENNSKWSYGIEYSRDNIEIPKRIKFVVFSHSPIGTPSEIEFESIKFNNTNYTFGLQFAYSIHKKFNLETALLYSNKDYNVNVYSDKNKNVIGSLIKQRYLTIPISISLTAFSIGKFKAFARGGTKFNFNIKYDEDENFSRSFFSQDLDRIYNKPFSEIFFGASLSYQVFRNLNVEAGYNYHALASNLFGPVVNEYLDRKTHSCFIRLNKKFKRKPKPEADVL